MSALTNALIGEYRLTEPLGAGGMGEVYKAVHTHLGRVVAVKILSPNLTDGPALQRFYNEASIQASLRHPSVAEYLGFYEYQGRPCILMEYVDGETLSELIQKRGAFPCAEATTIQRIIASAIAHFHAQGVVHRDIKAGNIKITSSGQVKILDFGIARHQRMDRLTHYGAVVGTTEALAPEQVRGEPATFATDVWQLGVLFYEMLTGRLPFQGNTTHEIYARILSAEYAPVRQLQAGTPEAVQRIVSRCLQKDPSRRYPSAAELHDALCSYDRYTPQMRSALHRLFRRAGTWIAAAIVMLIVAISTGLHRWSRDKSVETGPQAVEPDQKDGVNAATSGVPSTDAAVKVITVDTVDGAAQVLQGETPLGTTPFRVRARLGDKVDLVLRREGCEDLTVRFDVTERQVYTYTLKARKDR